MQEEVSAVKRAGQLKALAIVNIFETGKPFGEFAAVAVLNDGAGLSYGINQFTHRSGSLAAVVERYLELDGAVGRYALESALPNLRRSEAVVVRAYTKDERIKKTLRAAAVTREMRVAQLQIAFELYLKPAVDECSRLGFVTPLALAVVYDSITHGSYRKIRERVGTIALLKVFTNDLPERQRLAANRAAEPNRNHPQTEIEWITEYVRLRDRWLASIPRLNATRYRTRFFLNQIMLGSWELKLPLNVNGFWLRDGHIEGLLKFADVMIGADPATGPEFEPRKQINNPEEIPPASSQILTSTPLAQPPERVGSPPAKQGANSARTDARASGPATPWLEAVWDSFDRADSFVSGVAYRTDRIKSLWTTVLGTVWQAVWAVFGFVIGLPREVWFVVAVIAAALVLFYLYRQITLGRIREEINQ